MSEPIIVREKDYEFFEKSHQKKFTPATNNPLTQNRALKAGKARGSVATKLKSKGNFIDPLSRKGGKIVTASTSESPAKSQLDDPLSRQSVPVKGVPDPLSRQPANDPLSRGPRPTVGTTSSTSTSSTTSSTSNTSSMMNTSKTSETNQKEEEKKNEKTITEGGDQNNDDEDNELIGQQFWKDVRSECVKIYDLKGQKIDQLINNPFGQHAVKAEDRALMRAQTGGGQLQYNPNEIPSSSLAANQLPNQISLKNYIGNIDDLHRKMRLKWAEEDKVGALQIVIQNVKLMIDNEKPKFAPYQYVHVMEIVESFKSFVFTRMKKLSFPNLSDAKLKDLNFSQILGSNIPESAQEVSRNWIRKIGSIRELLPRLYLETALLPIYFFIEGTKIRSILLRLTTMTRALGDYINSLNFATYVIRVGAELMPKEKTHILFLLQDFFYYMRQGGQFSNKNLSTEEFFELFMPFLNTALRAYAMNCSDQEFTKIFELYQSSNQHSIVLKSMIEHFSSEHIANYVIQFFEIIKNFQLDFQITVYQVFVPKLAQGIKSKGSMAEICNVIWTDLIQLKSIEQFLNILPGFIELISKIFQGYQKGQIFEKIIDKFNELFGSIDSSSSSNAEIFVQLEDFIKDLLVKSDNISEILTLEPFLQFIGFFPSSQRATVSQNILQIFNDRDTNEKIRDPIAVNAILAIAQNLNELITLGMAPEQKKNLAEVIGKIVMRIDLGQDLEAALNLYTDIRASFGNISEIVENLIYRVIELTFKASKLSQNKASKKIHSFLQACIAYCYITIPMIENPVKQLQLFLISSEVSLVNNLISQAEAIFQSAISVLTEMPEQIGGKNTDELCYNIWKSMVSFLIVLPDDPEKDNLALYQSFIGVIEVFKWNKKNGEIYKLSIQVDLLQYLCAQIQEKLPYHISGVHSNDELFCDPEFKQTIVEQIDQVLQQVEATQQLINEKQGYDMFSNELIVQFSAQSINSLLTCFKSNQRLNGLLETFLILINKQSSDMNKDQGAKALLSKWVNLLTNTLITTEQNTKNLNDFENLKTSITKSINLAKNVSTN